ncbi:hypothetical protein NECAME_10636 [Necator americanus]|uniref:Uncharacterized protein n=1 Tax=Necator americanus TaxID=51031 RepID=W2T7Z8_NECAM|nr:hypothetical protein NECAME_10636 [Necator americanus]ETN78008.1 hypothetical protein NECAME_10636 [Necator americanus]
MKRNDVDIFSDEEKQACACTCSNIILNEISSAQLFIASRKLRELRSEPNGLVCNEVTNVNFTKAGMPFKAVPVAHYTQNETAFFERKHKAGDALAFDRNPEAFKRVTLLPAKELVAKLAEKARHMRRGEEADKHPDDREKNGECEDDGNKGSFLLNVLKFMLFFLDEVIINAIDQLRLSTSHNHNHYDLRVLHEAII